LRIIVGTIVFAVLTTSLAALPVQAAPQNEPKATAVPVKSAPAIDGVLDDTCWTEAIPVTEFHQRDPRQGEMASERTEVRIVYTRDAIYAGFRNYDSAPQSLVATERRRDEDLTRDDSVAVLLDTFHDHRNASLFRTNVLGTEFDALVTDEGRDVNVAWDERWEVATKTDEEGWTAEFMIPFKSLRMGHEEPLIWGIDFERVIRRKNEAVYWTNYSRDFKFETISQAGQLVGLENLALGLRLRVKPFLLAGFEKFPRTGGRTETNNLSTMGLEVLKYRPTAGLTLDVTYNTDFAQTEVDDLATNIERFPLFFPERREFFLEGAGTFEFGTGVGLGGSRDVMLFFSRRIGLAPSGVPIPILGGVKLSGRQGPYGIGLINMQTESSGGVPANNFTVGRIKRDVLGRSAIGALFTNRQSSVAGDHNRVFGADGNFVFARNLNIHSFIARSDTPGLNKDNWTGFGRVLWDSDFFVAGAEHLVVQRNFQPDVGWVPRRDQKRTTVQLGVRPRPAASDLLRQWIVRARLDLTQNQTGKQESMTYHYLTVETIFQSGDHLLFDFHRSFERLFEPFSIRPEITIPVGSYRSWDGLLTWTGAPHRTISGPLLRYRYEWDFFGGKRYELRIQPQIALSEALSLNVGYALDNVNLRWGNFTSHVINNRINYAFSNRWLTSATIQYSNLRSLVNYRLRLNYIHRPGDDLFVIYNEGRNVGEVGEAFLGRSIMVKYTYSFDF
jgi:hypothetical protein